MSTRKGTSIAGALGTWSALLGLLPCQFTFSRAEFTPTRKDVVVRFALIGTDHYKKVRLDSFYVVCQY